jgi:hypothetical protein
VDVREYLESLAKSEKLRGETVDNLKVVFHFSPPELLTEPAYLGRGNRANNVTTRKIFYDYEEEKEKNLKTEIYIARGPPSL